MDALREAYRHFKLRGDFRKNLKTGNLQKFKKVILYVVRTDANGELRESTPCVDCMNVIKSLNIKKVIHSGNEGKICIKCPDNYVSTHQTMGRVVLNRREKVT